VLTGNDMECIRDTKLLLQKKYPIMVS